MIKKQREPFWDNYKGVLIFLVVLGHFLLPYFINSSDSYAATITRFIYLFHMPAFIFTTGYLSKSPNVFKKESYLKLLLLYFIFNTVLMIYSWCIKDDSLLILKPYFSYWYLLSVIFWRLSVRFLSNVKYILPISIVVSILIGFWSDVNNTLSIVRTICFFPFFLLGYKYDFSLIKDKIKHGNNIKLIITSLITSMFFVSILVLSKYLRLDINILLYKHYDDFYDFLIRILLLTIGFSSIFLLYFSIPNKNIPLLTKIGKNCLFIYLAHRLFTLIFANYFTHQTYSGIYIIFAVVATFIVVLIFGSNRLNKYFTKFTNNVLRVLMEKTYAKYIFFIILIFILFLKPIDFVINGGINEISIKSFITSIVK